MFNSVKSKLTFLFTGSLLVILVIFIFTLYIFISGAIKNNELHELSQFYGEEEHEWAEELLELHHEDIDFEPDRGIFYYLFDESGRLVKGDETVKGLSLYIKSNNLQQQEDEYVKELEWESAHLLLARYDIQQGQQMIGSVIIGMDITSEKHLIQKIIWILIALALLFSLLFAWMGYFFAGQAMRPIQQAYLTQKKFVSDASHELRTPLSVFYSSIEILDKEKENLSPFSQDVLDDVKKEAELMHQLLNDLLMLARSDQGHFELELKEVDLSMLLQNLLERFSRVLPVSLQLESEITASLHIKGDSERLQQLFYILLDNASHYTEAGVISCTAKKAGEKIIVVIKDTGSGISPDDLPHIFDRFYRADPSRNRNGSGIGLSIAKMIAEAHGAKITVKSELDKGTEFTITFP
ncbi:sensor histidine kinase [Bacillus badius]|uniref:sensor histidine kinase n=1 Tax=Bacillus badius TaxID=1455 RepID=UPI000597B9A3|nr:HAMP domain-containing sensor histidine kinase [Bacillus badius]KIL76055.1 sensor histidine kinase [Bacillus badius]